MKKTTALPAIIVTALLITSFGVVCFLHVLSNKPIQFVDYWLNAFGVDYQVFFRASENIIHGQSPYAVALESNRYVYTPIPALANIILVPLGFDTARVSLYVLIPLALALGYLLITRGFDFPQTYRNQVLLAGLACLLFGYPSYFLIQRENIDGWVFLFLCLGLFFSQRNRMELWSGLFFSLAIAFKLYPVLILLPIFFYRKWRVLLWTVVWLALLAGLSYPWYRGFRTHLAGRLSDFELSGNGSLVATVVGFGNLLAAVGIPVPDVIVNHHKEIAAVIYGALILPVLFVDYRLSKIKKYDMASAALYVPFMIAWPQLVYPYAFVVCAILIPTMSHLWQNNANKIQSIVIVVIAIGIFLSQSQAFALYNLTGSDLAHAVPGVGLLILMGAIAFHKVLTLRLSVHADAALPATQQL